MKPVRREKVRAILHGAYLVLEPTIAILVIYATFQVIQTLS